TFRYGYRLGYRYQISDDSNGQVLWTEHTLNSRDQLTRGTFGNELHLEQYYDEHGYIRQADTYNPDKQTPISRPDFTLTYQFDSQTGNLDARQNYAYNHFENFQYDALDRLVQWGDETQQYDNRGRITQNKLGYYNYDDNKIYQNTSTDLFPEAQSYYQNREGIFNDGMEEQKGWSDLGLGWDIFGKPTYDDSKVKSGKYSLKI
ncbi:hypothetical protein, partial [Flavobacterium supellecticarium]|uniref:hypothetical protein n=1 Tax=Flavobacterium supellecticarium TaxID=2565924 RepID=UPI001454C851